MQRENRLKVAFALGALFLLAACTPRSESSVNPQLPGAEPFSADLQKKIEDKKKERGPGYKPRTKHLLPDGSAKFTNRLFLESSPYLLQHAHNPVNWYSWGEEAFATAKRLKRPVFLSVGYSTCHWCHVMEEESFEDLEIAEVLNKNYIAIKVDREERPDVDAIYMSAVQAMTGGGGWPMNVCLTPDKKPFFGGTYFPARDGDRGAAAGFLTIIKKLRAAYDEQPDKVAESSQKLTEAIGQILTPSSGTTLPEADILKKAAEYYKSRFDPKFGGLSGAPKFPSSLPVRFLLRFYRKTGDQAALKAATVTLEKMAAGGIHDHVGGGFHRYSTDEKWIVPHFEKMLYDNALLATTYLEAYQVTHREDFKKIVEDILRYLMRDMGSPEGGFYSATDADSPAPNGKREEGWFFTWTPEEIEQVLGPKDSKLVLAYFAITKSGNFEGRNILNAPESLTKVAKKFSLQEKIATEKIREDLEKLYEARAKRPPPHRDEKIIAAWNGLMISAFARAGFILNNQSHVETAERTAEFILEKMHKDGELFRSYKDGKANQKAFLVDYAFFIAGLIDLFEATGDAKWFKHAIALDRTLEKYFEDQDSGGFFMTGTDHEKLLAKEKPAYDGAEPSGNSVAVLNLLRFGEFTSDDSYRKRAEKALKAFSGTLASNPIALSEMLLALDFHLDKAKEIVIASPKGKSAEPFKERLRGQFLPNRVLVFSDDSGDESGPLEKLVPITKGKHPLKGKVTAYVCEKGVCKFPTDDPKAFSEQISASEKVK